MQHGRPLSTSIILALAVTLAGAAPGAELSVTVTGLRNATGTLRLCVWNHPEGFPDCDSRVPLARANLPAKPGRVTARFDVPAGTYAVSAFHDEANAGHVDTNFLGIPRNGVGASNDAHGRFGPPSFADAAFALGSAGGAINFALVYP